MKINSYVSLMFIFLSVIQLQAESSSEEAFSKIYEEGVWGVGRDGYGSSGGGSSIETTILYRQFLMEFLREHDIHSVVDLGCGDWEFSRTIDWKGLNYTGYDVVAKLIARNQLLYGTSNIHFVHADVIHTELPCADLLICKEVLQHLTNQDIMQIMRQFHKFRFCLITNDLGSNGDIDRGGYRGLDLSQPPFSLKAEPMIAYENNGQIKQVILLQLETSVF